MDIRPFRGWRYARRDLTGLLAPPYDVLSAEQKARLLAGDEQNIVAVDLPHVPPKTPGPDAVYAAAAEQLRSWQADGTIVQADAAAVYVYDQTYEWAGAVYTRRALLAGVRATPLGPDQDIIPHEHTFAGPKADRLKLARQTCMQLSPIFGFFDDDGTVDGLLAAATQGEPDAVGELDGVKQSLRAITDSAVIGAIRRALAATPVFIADGHHRYTTAMTYRDHLRAAGLIDDEHEANFVLFALVRRNDPGLLVLPTHRVVRGLQESFSLAALRESTAAFGWQQVDPGVDAGRIEAHLAALGPTAMALVAGPETWTARLIDASAMNVAAGDHSDPWRRLDVAVCQTLIMDGALAAWTTPETVVDYTPDARVAGQAVADGQADLAVLLQATPVGAVQAVARAGDVMPHKSTYFYPKLATGLVLKPLT